MHHYLHMAEGTYRDGLRGDTVRHKKYFYALRPVLACRWIESHDSMPPTEFARLAADSLPMELGPSLEGLLQRKRSGEELATGPRVDDIGLFLESEMTRLRKQLGAIDARPEPDWEPLDATFRELLQEAWA
jgi:predicted nucleotidyltransferase